MPWSSGILLFRPAIYPADGEDKGITVIKEKNGIKEEHSRIRIVWSRILRAR
jgi:hypothetical protein